MIIQSESFFDNAADTMNEVVGFLGLEPFDFQVADQLHRVWATGSGKVFDKPHNYPALEDATRRILTDFFEPCNQQLCRWLDEDLWLG